MRAMVKLHKYAKYAAILYIEIYIKHQFINYVTILKLLFVGHPLGFYNNKLPSPICFASYLVFQVFGH